MEISGRLATVSLADILQWAANDRRTGALVVRCAGREKRIYFERGRVVACLSDDPADYYGQRLLAEGLLTEDELLAALAQCREKHARLGAVLIERGLLSPETVRETLRRQIADAICEVFLWERGVFYFEVDVPPESEIAPSPVDTFGLVMEGTRWLDEHRRIRRLLVHDNVVLGHGPRRGEVDLTPIQGRITAAVDGRRPLGEVYTAVRGSRFRFLEATFALCLREVLDIASVGEPEDDAPARELTLTDLLVEQAASEEVELLALRHLALPVGVVAQLVPVWASRPPFDEVEALPGPLAAFSSGIDGRVRLAELLSTEVELRARQLDYLVLQLQRRRLALLPERADFLEQEADRRGAPPRVRWWRRWVPS